MKVGFEYKQKLLAKIAGRYELKFVILHGSYANSKPRDDSDLDIAVLPKKILTSRAMLRLYREVEKIFGNNAERELDLKILSRVDPLFRYQITKDGVLLYGNQADYEQYKAVSFRMYEDSQPLFDLENLLSKKYQRHLNQLVYA